MITQIDGWKSDLNEDVIYETKEEAQKWEAAREIEQLIPGTLTPEVIAEAYTQIKTILTKIGK